MTSATTHSLASSSSLPDSTRSIPTLEELCEWTSEPDDRIVIRGVDWGFYEQLVDSIPEGANLHVNYDGKDLEIMTLGPNHDGCKKLSVDSSRRSRKNWRSLTRVRGKRRGNGPRSLAALRLTRAISFRPEKLAMVAQAKARRSRLIADYPNPDLGIEVDISPSKIDRPGIYAALQVAEVWRFEGETEQVIIERLGEDGVISIRRGERVPPDSCPRGAAVGDRGGLE